MLDDFDVVSPLSFWVQLFKQADCVAVTLATMCGYPVRDAKMSLWVMDDARSLFQREVAWSVK